MEYLIAVIALVLIGIFLFLSRRKKVPLPMRPRIRSLITQIESIEDPTKKVLEADKLLHETFRALGQKGSMGDSLKLLGAKLPNEQSVWNAHILRNRIAHEPMMTVSHRDADAAVKALVKAANSFL